MRGQPVTVCIRLYALSRTFVRNAGATGHILPSGREHVSGICGGNVCGRPVSCLSVRRIQAEERIALFHPCNAGYAFADSYIKLLLLALVQGGCFGLATTAGITVAIDITTSVRRSAGNMVYAWSARLGMLIGAGIGILLYDLYGFRTVVYLAIAVGVLSMYFTSRVYVAFRAPIGMKLCSLDRFLLPRAWVPALNMLLIAFVPGVLLPLLYVGDYIAFLTLGVLVLLTIPFTRMFVKLSHHCQRGTGNTTCYLAMETGLLAGLATACRLSDAYLLYHAAGVAAMLALFFFVLLTYPYYKRKKVR